MVTNNGSETIVVEEIIGMQYDLFYMDILLNQTVHRHTDMNTANIEIVLVERNGLLVSTSFSAPTVSNGSRLHLAHTNERYKRLATALTERTILHTSSSQLASGASNQRLDKHLITMIGE